MSDRNDEFVKGYALGRKELTSLHATIRNLVDLVNEHTFLFMALMKKLGTNPEELMASLDEKDFLNDEDVPKEPEEPKVSIN